MRRCKSCGQLLGDDEKFCPSCGISVTDEDPNIPEPEQVKEETQYSYQTKICKKCGASIHIDAVICPKCGCVVQENNYPDMQQQETSQGVKRESPTLGTLSVIFGALGGVLGFILGCIGLFMYKEPQNRKKCKIGIGLFIGWFVLYIILGLLE